jgi:hypothetical protein
MEGDTTTASMQFVIDEDSFASDLATKVPTQQSVKAYIAAQGHVAVTVADSSEIDFTLTGQQISAAIVAGSIDETKLDASTNASLDLADSALQSSAIGVSVQAYDADLTTWAGLTPSANHQTLVTQTFAQMRASLDLEAGTDFYSVAGAQAAFQPLDADLTTLATPTAWRVFYSDGSQVITQLALGADGTFLKSNGASSAPTFATPAGSGDVTKVGTPVDNQIGVWTGDGTIQGTAAFTFDSATDTLVIAASGNLLFGAVTILDDAAGTMTLSNIDAIDATTEATIEAAIDALPNLVSVQSLTITLADAGADILFGWDDSASAYQNLSAADVRTALALVVGTNVQAFDAELAAIAGLTSAADRVPYFTGSGTAALATFTTAGRALVDDADAAAQRTTLELVGQQTIWLPAAAMVARTTNGAASGSLETGTNDVMAKYLAFDSTTSEGAQFAIQMPLSWNEGTIVAQFVWTHPATVTNFGVRWGIRAVAFANDDALDTAFGTEQEVTDTGGTTSDVYVSPETSAMTVAGTPGAEELVVFEVYRDPADGNDTMAVDAYLLGVKIHYTTDAARDD